MQNIPHYYFLIYLFFLIRLEGKYLINKFLIILHLIFILSFPVFTQNEINFEEFDLDNGLHVILHEDHTTPILTVTVMYHVGSKNEKEDRTGFAHFFEHLMFEGSPNILRGEYFKLVQNAGGELNASTDFDRTFYFEILPSNQLELGLWLESERMMHLKIDTAGVETQREVVKEERSESLDNQPYGRIWEETFKRAYTVHPYKWMPIGSAQYIDKAGLFEFMDFYSTYYVPQNAVLTIAGDINIDAAKDLVEKYFKDIPRGRKEIIRPEVIEPAQTHEVRDTVYDNVQLPAIVEAYHVPPIGTKDYYSIDMLTTLLSTGQSSRLYKSLVDEQQKAVYIGAFPAGLEDPGLFIAVAIANSGVNAGELEKSIDAEIQKVKDSLIAEEEYQKLRNQIKAQFVNKNSRVAGIAEDLSKYFMLYGDTDLINSEIEKYMEVTKDDIKNAAAEYLKKENRVVLYYLPINSRQNGVKK
jgi:predicted Zn-dependent peptidase